MQQLNTIHVENLINKVRIAAKSGQKTVNLDIKEAVALTDSLSIIMTRLSGELDAIVSQLQNQGSATVEVEMDGGKF
jgi:ribosomal silencing factor RsfS